jgi:hypothetical protein
MSALCVIDKKILDAIDRNSFRKTDPFPWVADRFLVDEAFQQLLRDFPPLAKFERHVDIRKKHGQRPHNRHYLAYERTLYDPDRIRSEGTITHAELRPSWQEFMAELESKAYRDFIGSMLGVDDFVTRYAWHIGTTGSEVSPHIDSDEKLGTHIFYFNTSADWSSEWGGETIVLRDKTTPAMNPEFEDFKSAEIVPFLDNRAFLFGNNGRAWHGARALSCPEGRIRRLFNVIFERPRKASFASRMRSIISRPISTVFPNSR